MSKSKQDIFLEAYEPIHEKFEKFCKARVYGNMEASDLINETLLVAFDKFETLKSKEAFLSFLCTISSRILSNAYHKKKERLLKKEDGADYLNDSNADSGMDAEIHFLYEALAKLSEEQREAIILFEISGFSNKEIAKIQNASLSAVKQRIKRGRDKLIALMNFESEYKIGEEQYG